MSMALNILASLLAMVVTFVSSLIAIVFGIIGFERGMGWLVQVWAKMLTSLAGVRFEVQGLENLPESAALYVFNHTSLLDIPAIYSCIPKRLRFGAKKELFYIPFFGLGMRLFGIVPIDRGNRRRSIQQLRKFTEKIKNEEISLVLAPEGTRQNGEILGEFKTGPFITALQAQIPVVPIVIRGLHRALPKNSLVFRRDRRVTCSLQVLPPLSTKGMTEQDRSLLKSEVHKKMSEAFQRS